jgi:hypothetical protein
MKRKKMLSGQYVCSKCGRAFDSILQLRTHERAFKETDVLNEISCRPLATEQDQPTVARQSDVWTNNVV